MANLFASTLAPGGSFPHDHSPKNLTGSYNFSIVNRWKAFYHAWNDTENLDKAEPHTIPAFISEIIHLSLLRYHWFISFSRHTTQFPPQHPCFCCSLCPWSRSPDRRKDTLLPQRGLYWNTREDAPHHTIKKSMPCLSLTRGSCW